MTARIRGVDDDRCMRDLLKLHLASAGYHVRVAEDALVAGRMLLQSPPDLLLVDIEKPSMSGVGFVATLVADQSVPYVPVIFLTAREDFADHAEGLGAVFLTKPCQ